VKRIIVLTAAAALFAGACGGGTTHAAVPDVTGERLDLAQRHLNDAGFKYEAIGGGTFGIVVESNWTVCSTEPAAGASSAETVKLIVDRACSTSSGGVVESSTSTTQAVTASSTSTTTATTVAAPPTVKIRVPAVVGKDLQTAQDTMQAAGLYNLTSHDSTGLGRMQILDRNWLVTSQAPVAGSMVDEGQLIDLGAKKFTD